MKKQTFTSIALQLFVFNSNTLLSQSNKIYKYLDKVFAKKDYRKLSKSESYHVSDYLKRSLLRSFSEEEKYKVDPLFKEYPTRTIQAIFMKHAIRIDFKDKFKTNKYVHDYFREKGYLMFHRYDLRSGYAKVIKEDIFKRELLNEIDRRKQKKRALQLKEEEREEVLRLERERTNISLGEWIYHKSDILATLQITKDKKALTLTRSDGKACTYKKTKDYYFGTSCYGSTSSTYKIKFIDDYTLNIAEESEMRKTLLGYATTKSSFGFKKIRNKEIENTKNMLDNAGILFRQTFNGGELEEYLVPKSENFWNTVKYIIDGNEVLSKDSYYEGGGYEKIYGYTSVYQFINQSEDNFVFEVFTTGTKKISTKIKNAWAGTIWTSKTHDTKTEYSYIEKIEPIILLKGEKFKGSDIVGDDKSKDYAVLVRNFHKVSDEWMKNLEKAITGNDLELVDKFLKDPIAKIFKDKLKESRSRIISNNKEAFDEKYKEEIKVSIKIVDEMLFDADFDSDVIVIIENSSSESMIINYKTPFGSFSEELEPNGILEKNHKIKGHKKEDLVGSVISVKPKE